MGHSESENCVMMKQGQTDGGNALEWRRKRERGACRGESARHTGASLCLARRSPLIASVLPGDMTVQ